MPPRTRQEFRIRQNVHSVPLLNRLTETLTSLGLLIIDGINPEQDWLERDSLLAAIEQLQPAQVVWCGIADVAGLPEDYRQLVQTGHIAVYPAVLPTQLQSLGPPGSSLIIESSQINQALSRSRKSPTLQHRTCAYALRRQPQ